MKRILMLLAFAAGLAFFAGCHASSGGGVVVYPNSMSATIAGVFDFTASGGYITATKTNGTLVISSTSSASSGINAKFLFTMANFHDSVATYAINDIGLPVGVIYDSLNNGNVLHATSGSITFTSVSPYLQGTFYFTCSDSTRITDGTFKIKAP